MLDKLLAIGSAFDWISPTIAAVDDVRYGPGVGFRVSVSAGWSGKQIKDLLHQWGVKTWGWMIVNDLILFNVNKSHASYAKYVLERFSVPYNGG